jgi:NADP-dependent 3-hydroxy acid dehydrogenase YdfG
VASFGSGVYNMTKWGVVGFSEALRQECSRAGVRVTAIEPGWVDTELQGHNEHPAVVAAMEKAIERVDRVLDAEDIARAIAFAVTQPAHVSINEMLIRPTTQR